MNAALTVTDSTISGNTADFSSGGGIWKLGASPMTLTDSTIAGNLGLILGGGIHTESPATLQSVTIAGNLLNNSDGGFTQGSGINSAPAAGTVTLTSSLIAGNHYVDLVDFDHLEQLPNDCGGSSLTSLGNNLIGTNANCGVVASTGDLLDLNPLIAPLGAYGGPTETVALYAGSPAL